MSDALTTQVGRVFRSQWVQLKHKVLLLELIVQAKLLCNAHAWGPLTEAQHNMLHSAYSKAARVVLGKTRYQAAERTADTELYVPHTSLLPVELLMRQKRLLYLSRIRFKAPKVLSAQIQAEAEMPDS